MLAEKYGRREIYTDATEITGQNVIRVLRDAMLTHTMNADRCNFLLNYEAGVQPIARIKTYRPDIDCRCVDNVAAEVTEFKLGFVWGNAITLSQRGDKDSGSAKEGNAINILNECYEAEGIRNKTQKMARFIEICGVGYELVDINDDWEDGDSYFNIEPLDPRFTFIVRSTRVGNKPMMGVTYRQDKLGNYFFTCFTKDERFEVLNQVRIINPDGEEEETDEWTHIDGSGARNPLGTIPIIEWIRSADRMGCFERQISEMDNLNLLVSDYSNQVDQNTQSIWVTVDVDFPTDENGNLIHPASNDWLQTYSTRDGKAPNVYPLATQYDYAGQLENIITRRALILQKCNVPQRNDNSGGSTGIAMSDATGWSSAESSACKEESIIEACKIAEVKAVLKAIRKSPFVEKDSPLMELRAIDIVPSIKRQKTYEMSTKMNTFATGITHGLDYKALLREINFFSDPQQVIEDSEPTIKRFLDKTFGTEEETEPEENTDVVVEKQNTADDPQNQIDNSPMLDGLQTRTEQSEE